MSQRMLLVAASLPVVLGSMVLADWARDDPSTPERNVVRLSAPADVLCAGRSALCQLPTQEHSAKDNDVERACHDRAKQWAAALPNGHEVIVRTPFVLAGNLSADELHEVYAKTLAPASEALRRLYFQQRPDEPVTLLLFGDERSYRDAAWGLFGQRDVSIYGYYKPSSRTIVINRDAGDGTMVHELVHALIDFDFPGIPIWLNEGIASLYEQCQVDIDDDGPQITPLLNWRLSILHNAMADGTLGSVEQLAGSAYFHGDNEALKYAHARYFCLYLEHHGLLDDYYQLFRENGGEDPQGIATLSGLLERPFRQIDRDFQRWAFGLQLAQRP